MSTSFRYVLLTVAVASCCWLLLPHTALAANITPTVFTDDITNNGNCTLREAIQAANTDTAVDACSAGLNNDSIWLSNGTYTISLPGNLEDNNQTGDFDLTSSIIFYNANPGTSTIRGGGVSLNDRVFDISATASVNFTGVTITGGYVTDDIGGGIYADAAVNIIGCTITGNTAAGSTGAGGGIYIAAGAASIQQSLISSNSATYGSGGLEIAAGATATIGSSTFLNNTDVAPGAGGGGLSNFGTTTITNSTFSGNTSIVGGGAILNGLGSVTLVNDTIAYNSATLGGGGIYSLATLSALNTVIANNTDLSNASRDCDGTLTSNGYNLISSTTGCTIAGTTTGNQLNVNPLLNTTTTEAFNGPVYMVQSSSSPIIDAGTNSGCPSTDQRLRARPQIGKSGNTNTCDIGSVEFDYIVPTISNISVTPVLNSITATGQLRFTASELGSFANTSNGNCIFSWQSTTNILNYVYTFRSQTTAQGVHSCSFSITDAAGNSTGQTFDFTFDSTAPRFEMNGPRTIYINVGDTFTDPGVTAIDNLDTQISSRVHSVSTVDTSTAGKYEVQYSLVDWAANSGGSTLKRNVFVLPRTGAIVVTKGVATIKINGASKKFTPFPGYTGDVFGRMVAYGKGVTRYVFVQTGARSSGRIRVINEKGKDVVYMNTANKKISTLAVDATTLRNGILADFTMDKNTLLGTLAIVPKIGKNVPLIFTVDRTTTQQRSVTGAPTGGSSGTILLKQIPITSGSPAVVTAVAGQVSSVRAWQRQSNGSYAYAATLSRDPFAVTNKTITFRKPIISNITYSAVENGKMYITWKTDIASTTQVLSGRTSTALKGTSVNSVPSKTHTASISAQAGTAVYIQTVSCTPKLPASQGCMTTTKQLITPR